MNIEPRAINPLDYQKADIESLRKLIGEINTVFRNIINVINGKLELSNLQVDIRKTQFNGSDVPLCQFKVSRKPVIVLMTEINRDAGAGTHTPLMLSLPDWTWESGNVMINAIAGVTGATHDAVFVFFY